MAFVDVISKKITDYPPLKLFQRTVHVFNIHRKTADPGILEKIIKLQIAIMKNNRFDQLQNWISLNVNREFFAQILFILVR